MFASLYAKLMSAALVAALLAGAGLWLHHSGAVAGAARVQAQWDAAKAVQAAAAITASESARKTETAQTTAFANVATHYLKDTTDAYPSIADALPAAVAAGAVRLRDTCPAPPASRGVPETTAAARALDAAATAALAQRTKDAIDLVRLSDAADKRESDFRALIVALRATLAAERHTNPQP